MVMQFHARNLFGHCRTDVAGLVSGLAKKKLFFFVEALWIEGNRCTLCVWGGGVCFYPNLLFVQELARTSNGLNLLGHSISWNNFYRQN